MKKTTISLTLSMALVLCTCLSLPAYGVSYGIQEERNEAFTLGTESPDIGTIHIWRRLFDWDEWYQSQYFDIHNPQNRKTGGPMVWETDQREVYQVKAVFTIPVPAERIIVDNLLTIQNVKRMLPDAEHNGDSRTADGISFNSTIGLPTLWAPALKLKGKDGFVSMKTGMRYLDAAALARIPGMKGFFENERDQIYKGELVGLLLQTSDEFNQMGVFSTSVARVFRSNDNPQDTVVVMTVAFAIAKSYLEEGGGAGRQILQGQPASFEVSGTTIDIDPRGKTGIAAGLPKYTETLLGATASLLSEQ